MTFCIAWRELDNIHIVSDSRVTFGTLDNGEQISMDHAVKVISIPVNIYGPTDDESGNREEIRKLSYGFCFAGRIEPSRIIREMISSSLSDIQIVPSAGSFFATDYSFSNIINSLCNKYILPLSESVGNEMAKLRGGIDLRFKFLITGYCDFTGIYKAFMFEWVGYGHEDANSGPLKISEVLKDNGDRVFWGDGTQYASSIQSNYNCHFRGNIDFLQHMIENESFPSIGGDIQYGSFYKELFEVKGVRGFALDNTGNPIWLYKNVGFSRSNPFPSAGEPLFYSKFIQPFKEQDDNQWKKYTG